MAVHHQPRTRRTARQARDQVDLGPLASDFLHRDAGDTVEHYANRMALIDRQLDRFRVLNGLDANDQLKPGEYVKIIVE